MAVRIGGHVQLLENLAAVPRLFQHLQPRHFIHPEMLEDPRPCIEPHHVIILIVPQQDKGADHIERPLPAELLPSAYGVPEIAETDLPVCADGPVYIIHIIIDGFIHGFDAVFHPDLPPELAGLPDAGEFADLIDQFQGFFPGDKPGGLDAVHQQLQLRKLERPAGHIPARLGSAAGLFQIQAELPEGLQVVVDAFALGGDPLLPEILDELGGGDGVFLVGIFLQILPKDKKLHFLAGRSGHGLSPSSVTASAGQPGRSPARELRLRTCGFYNSCIIIPPAGSEGNRPGRRLYSLRTRPGKPSLPCRALVRPRICRQGTGLRRKKPLKAGPGPTIMIAWICTYAA